MKLFSSNRYKKALAIVLMVVVLLVPPLAQFTVPFTFAAQLTSAKLNISNSQANGANVTYVFSFVTPATTSIGLWTIQFCTTASGACTLPTNMDTTAAAISSDNIAGTGRTNDFSVNGTLESDVDTPAAQNNQNVTINYTGIENPTTENTTFFARITTYQTDDTTPLDTATVAAATLTSTSIAVSATVDPNFTFSIAGVASGAPVNGATTTASATASTIPFGTLTAGTPAIAAQDVTISTNAGSGYTITASHAATIAGNPPLTSGATNNIDAFSGTNASPATWAEPAGTTANTNTGYFGYTTEDATLCTGTASRFSSNLWAGSTTQGLEVVCSAAGVSNQTHRVGYQTEVNSIQPAGSYTGTVILIATPTY